MRVEAMEVRKRTESHLSKQLDVFFVAAVKSMASWFRVVLTRFHGE